jgi:hypothetical protein
VSSIDRPHGDYRKYRQGCRCTECREGNRTYQAAANARRGSDPRNADRAGHGRNNTYVNYGCRCTACRAANTVRLREYREARASKSEAGR